jgi:hypothetical protein
MGEVRTDAFAFPMPEGWSDRTVVTITGPGDDTYAPNIVVTRELLCDGMGLGAYSSGWLNRLAAEVPVSELRPVEHLDLAGRRAHLRVVGWAAVGLRLRQIAVLTVVGDEGWAMVGTATEWQFDELEAQFRALLSRFEIVPTAVRA